LKWFKKNIEVEFWDDISTMPFFYWRKIHETGEADYVVKKGKAEEKDIRKAWHEIHNQYIKKYGLDNKTKLFLQKKKRLATYINKYLSTGNRVYEMEVDIMRKEFEQDAEGKDEVQDYTTITSNIEKYFGFQIDEMNTSVDKYYSYLSLMKKEAQKLKSLAK